MSPGRRANLDAVALDASVTALPVEGRVSVGFPDDRSGWFDPSEWACPSLRREISAEIVWQCRPGGRIGSPGTLSAYARACRIFLSHLADIRSDHLELRLVTLGADDVNRFETAQAERAERTDAYIAVTTVVALLRDAADRHTVSPELANRLAYTTSMSSPKSRPRDAYSPNETAAIRDACLLDVVAVTARLTRTDAELWGSRAGRSAEDPWTLPDLVRLAAEDGPIDQQRLLTLLGRGRRGDLRAAAVNAEVFPTIRDLVPFFVLLSLETGLEVEAVKALDVDCLANRSGGRVDIRFVKRRRHGHEQGVVRVADHGMFSPGSLVRLVLAITGRAREHFTSDRLWIHHVMGRFHESHFVVRSSTESCAFMLWVRDHGLMSEDGSPLSLTPARLRKTHMAGRYRATAGQLDEFRLNHGRDVAANNYAKIPALREIHEATIAEGLADALSAAIDPPRVLTEDPGESSGVEPGTVDVIRRGELDVWVSACTGFFSSPFGANGSPCPTPVWGCLACENAVFTTTRLPSIIRLLDHIGGQRASLDDQTWQSAFGSAYARITDQVLPAFADAVVATAQAIARTGEAEIPPSLLGTTR